MKRSLILIVVLVVLLGLYWLVQSKRPVVSADRPFVKCDSAAVSLLRVEAAPDTVELMKEGDNWILVRPLRYPAATRTVASAVGRFKQMQKLSMVTDRVERASEFQVDDVSGTKVTVGQGGKRQTFYLGKAGPTA